VGPKDARVESAKDRSCIKLEPLDDEMTPTIIDAPSETYSENELIYDDEIPVEDAECFEIEDTTEEISLAAFKNEPIDRLISPIPSFELGYLKSPLRTVSDCGYESVGSPQEYSFTDTQNNWNMLDLFPALAD
jgi:hypothetical protein